MTLTYHIQSCIYQSDQAEFWVLLLDIKIEHSRSLSKIHSFSNAFYSMSCPVVILPSVRFPLYEFPQQEDFTRLNSQSNAEPPTWRTRVPLLVWLLPFDLSAKGDPTSSYATGGIALQVIGVFVRITVMFSYANSYMFPALLTHHQTVHSCIKQSWHFIIISNMWNCHKFNVWFIVNSL